jgi:DnaJ-class molecular chaperone
MKFYIFIFIFIFISAATDTKIIITYKGCPMCQGHGTTKCSNCLGTGKIRIYDSFNNKRSYHINNCPNCDGKGYSNKCYYCGGTGKIKVETIPLK